MLALLLPQAVLGAKRGRSMASPGQSGSMAPALHTRGAQILNVSHKLIFLPFSAPGNRSQSSYRSPVGTSLASRCSITAKLQNRPGRGLSLL
jgi:hypothetical protein